MAQLLNWIELNQWIANNPWVVTAACDCIALWAVVGIARLVARRPIASAPAGSPLRVAHPGVGRGWFI